MTNLPLNGSSIILCMCIPVLAGDVGKELIVSFLGLSEVHYWKHTYVRNIHTNIVIYAFYLSLYFYRKERYF